MRGIYSGLNNLAVYTILDKPFSAAFGFTEQEVERILCDCDLSDKLAEVQQWYYGYRFGETTIYNPWSILNMAGAPDEPLKAHSISIAGSQLIHEQILSSQRAYLEDFQALLDGQAILKELHVSVTQRQRDAESLWELLLFSGYLTALSYDPITGIARLTLPNFETGTFFRHKVQQFLAPSSARCA